MKYMLDTHSLIWFIGGSPQLSDHARQLIDDVRNDLVVSIATLWEMAIKFSIGRLTLGLPFEQLFPDQLTRNSMEILAVSVDHLKVVCSLPFHHRDPFDRLMVAQASVENLPIISVDRVFDDYGIAREW
ncbi:MAG: type II toxin-antitoxin system VapC family toxin [Planctomycetaceae bacterium]